MTATEQPAPSLPDAEALFRFAPCGLLVTTHDGTIRRVNATLCAWLGRTDTELVDRTRFQDLMTVGSRIFHQTHWAPLLQIQGSVAEVKLELRGAGGESIPAVVNAVRREHGGHTFHEIAVIVAEDRHQYERELLRARRRAEDLLTQEQRTRQALADAQAELDRQRTTAEDRALFAEQMMGIVSHDLRNPLTVIRMSAHILQRGELTSQQRTALQRLSHSTERAIRLIADLLDFTRARMGQDLPLTIEPVDLHSLVGDSVDELRAAYPTREIVHHRSGDGPCSASTDRLVQAIGNLVSNAIQHGRSDSPITVRSEIDPQRCAITVHNEGDAIGADALASIFEPMVRGAGQGVAQGVGLGLFIVREIARAHGGDVAVESTGAAGTAFAISFPPGGRN
jgi:sigma-B regulation protein RsbU (phosphoserine phosphatase)